MMMISNMKSDQAKKFSTSRLTASRTIFRHPTLTVLTVKKKGYKQQDAAAKIPSISLFLKIKKNPHPYFYSTLFFSQNFLKMKKILLQPKTKK